jgi:serine/threonine-protein kinase RsbW
MPRLKTSEIPGLPVSIRLTAQLENLPHFLAPVLAVARALKLGQERCDDLELALEESLVNVFNYAYPDTTGSVTVGCRVADNHLIILIEDEGVAFPVTGTGSPDLSSAVSDRKIGGLGIHLVRSLMDDVRYRREGTRNLLELILFLKPGEGVE